MTFRGRLTKLRAAALGLAILFAALSGAGSPAKADIVDCLNAIAPVGTAAKISELTTKVAACSSEATSNPMMAVVMAVMLALRADDVFTDSTQCNGMIDGAVSKLVGAALKAINIGGAAIDQLIEGQIGIGEIPGLGETLLHLTSCGCAVAGAPGDAKAIADEYIASVDGCGAFAGEAVSSIASGIFASGWFSHGAASPGTIPPEPYTCPAGFLSKVPLPNICDNDGTCKWDGKSYYATALGSPIVQDGSPVPCVCGGYFPPYPGMPKAIETSSAFFCQCPKGEGYNNDGSCTKCPAGQAIGDSGQCRAGKPNEAINYGSWWACGDTLVAYQNGDSAFCGPKCADGSTIDMGNTGFPQCKAACGPNAVFDKDSKLCVDCTPKKQVAAYSGIVKNSLGQCAPCGDGFKISFHPNKTATCEAACAEGSVLEKGVCVDCNKQNKIAVSLEGKGSLGSCRSCQAVVQKRDGNSCVPAIDCESWQKVAPKFGGIGVNGGGAICVSQCPGGVFTPASGGGTTTFTDPITHKTVTTITAPVLESCKPCDDKKVLDAASNTCVSCTGGNVWHAAVGGKPSYCAPAPKVQPVVVPPPNIKPVESPKTIPDVVKPPLPEATGGDCPPGRVRTSSGRCIVPVDTDDGSRGGGSIPGGRTGPGGGGITLPPSRAPGSGGRQ